MVHEPIQPRFFPRADADLDGSVEDAAGVSRCKLKNLSEGGVFVIAERKWNAGQAVVIEIALPNSTVRAEGVIRWSRPEPNGNSFGSGIALETNLLSERDALAIRAFVEQREPIHWEGERGQLPRSVAVRYVPVIRREAHRLARRLPPHVSSEDLVGAGFVGLLEAHKRYDASFGDCFEGYALDAHPGRHAGRAPRERPLVAQNAAARASHRGDAHRLEQGLERRPSEEEVAEALDLSLEDYRACQAALAAGAPTSIDAAPPEFAPRDEATKLPDEQLVEDESLRRLGLALGALPPRIKQVLELYYGQELTLRSIGGILGVTESRVSQILSQAVRRLRSEAKRAPGAPLPPIIQPASPLLRPPGRDLEGSEAKKAIKQASCSSRPGKGRLMGS